MSAVQNGQAESPARNAWLSSCSVASVRRGIELAALVQRVERERQGEVIVSSFKQLVHWASFGSSFILTGNLLAPYVGSVSSDLLFSVLQRAKYEQLTSSAHRHMASMLKRLKAVKEARQQEAQQQVSTFAQQSFRLRPYTVALLAAMLSDLSLMHT